MPDVFEQLHVTVQRGLGQPPAMEAIRRRHAARARRRLVPVASLALASIVAVGAVVVVQRDAIGRSTVTSPPSTIGHPAGWRPFSSTPTSLLEDG